MCLSLTFPVVNVEKLPFLLSALYFCAALGHLLFPDFSPMVDVPLITIKA